MSYVKWFSRQVLTFLSGGRKSIFLESNLSLSVYLRTIIDTCADELALSTNRFSALWILSVAVDLGSC